MDVPPTITYASVVFVVLLETICVAITMAALNTLKVRATDIMKA